MKCIELKKNFFIQILRSYVRVVSYFGLGHFGFLFALDSFLDILAHM